MRRLGFTSRMAFPGPARSAHIGGPALFWFHGVTEILAEIYLVLLVYSLPFFLIHHFWICLAYFFWENWCSNFMKCQTPRKISEKPMMSSLHVRRHRPSQWLDCHPPKSSNVLGVDVGKNVATCGNQRSKGFIEASSWSSVEKKSPKKWRLEWCSAWNIMRLISEVKRHHQAVIPETKARH